MNAATRRTAVNKGGQREGRSTPLTCRLQPPFGQLFTLEGPSMGTCNKLHQIPAFGKWPRAGSVAASAIPHRSLSFGCGARNVRRFDHTIRGYTGSGERLMMQVKKKYNCSQRGHWRKWGHACIIAIMKIRDTSHIIGVYRVFQDVKMKSRRRPSRPPLLFLGQAEQAASH
jgi:hypothetical protein